MRYLITSALPYINGVKHLGNLVGSMLPADIYCRYLRQQGKEVLFICATDEHGTPAELAALEAGVDVQVYCQRQHELQADVYSKFGLSFDYFGRSSSNDNHELTKHIFEKLDENGLIEERQVRQMYCLDDARFLPDRYVVGTCPYCGYSGARGDQCENCTKVLDPTDLIGPRSAVSGSSRIEMRASRHLFLKLASLSDELRSWLGQHPNWPTLTKSVALKWLDEGLRERCITRDLSWGVPVPRPGFEGKVFYVWFDAPIEYIAATKTWASQSPAARDYTDWWRSTDDVYYVQFMAKDNLPFHTIMFPAMLLGTREPWKLPDYIKGFHWLNYYGDKFSTSARRGVFLDQALEVLPPDVWRYALISTAPESSDSTFTWESFQTKVNSDLADNLGNFVNRTLKLGQSFGSGIPEGGERGDSERQLQAQAAGLIQLYRDSMEGMEFRKATDALRSLWSAGNLYIYERAPWKLVKQDRNAAAQVVRTCINLVGLYATLSLPIIPFTGETILEALKVTEEERKKWSRGEADLEVLRAGRPFEVPAVLFPKLEDEHMERLRQRFGGRDV